jgi:SAM-dependent methyltransferase
MSDERGHGVGLGTLPVREGRNDSAWFREHFDEAADAIISFFGGDRISLRGKEVADVGSGDGIIDLALALKAEPANLTGFDIVLTDVERLRELALRENVADALPANLAFSSCEPRRIPATDDAFDIVTSWSTFEHVDDPAAVLAEIHRILRPYGLLMIQIWPLYYSQHGSHLWQFFPAGFEQLLTTPAELEAAVRKNPGPEPDWAEVLIEQFRSCNRLTLDELQQHLHAAGFAIHKVELLSEAAHLPPGIEHFPLSQLTVSGIKLIASAVPRA